MSKQQNIEMIKKHFAKFLIGIIVLILVAFGWKYFKKDTNINTNDPQDNQQSASDSVEVSEEYKVNMGVYIKNEINVSYPQVAGLSNVVKQDKINSMLRERAISIHELNDSDKDISYFAEGTYEIKCETSNVLSILYTSYTNFENSAHPSNLAYTITIDMKTGNEMKISDFISSIDSNFVNKLKQGKYVGALSEEKEIRELAFNSYETDEDIVKVILNQRGAEESWFYVTPTTLGISISVPHFAGDHAEFEIER